MKITAGYDTIHVSDLRDFDERQAEGLVHDLRLALRPPHSVIEFDLAHLRSADCATVDALLAVYEGIDEAGAGLVWRLLNPSPDLRQLCELVRLHHVFEITPPRPPRMVLL